MQPRRRTRCRTILALGAGAALGSAAVRSESGTPAPTVAASSLDSLRALAVRLIPVVEELRGSKFRHGVPVVVEPDSATRRHFAARLDRFMPPPKLHVQERAWAQLGLIPDGTDLRALLLDLLEEQAG